jgi:predicted transcriptional regulator
MGDLMAETGRAENVDPGLVAEIVRSYVAKNSVAADQLGNLIATVQRALSSLGEDEPAPAPAPLAPAVPIRRSVRPDYVVCLECGFHAQILRRHLRVQHGLSVAEYRVRWNLSPNHPVTAPAYSSSRAVIARQIGLGRRRVVIETSPEPPRQRRSRGRPRNSKDSN